MLAVRNPEKGNAALSRIIAASPRADVTLQALDLSSLDSVHSTADALRATYPRIDLLINSAGVMWTPKQVTKDGFQPLKAVLGPVLFQSAAMGGAADAAGRHRSCRAVLRPRRFPRAARPPQGRRIQRAVPRRRFAASALGGLRRAHRRHLSGLTGE